MPTWVIPELLARSSRPGYLGGRNRLVPTMEVDEWLARMRASGIKSIICLLSDDQPPLYGQLPIDLITNYRNAGFKIAHVPAHDHRQPPLSQDQLERIWAAYEELPKPVLVHCSAGIERTGAAVDYINQRLSEG